VPLRDAAAAGLLFVAGELRSGRCADGLSCVAQHLPGDDEFAGSGWFPRRCETGERRRREEALSWSLPRGSHVQQSARQFFNHALDRDLIPRNVFTRLGVRKRTGLIHVRRHLDLASGVIGWPKDDEPRDIAMGPRLHRHLQTMPRLSLEILFPTPRGRYMRRSTWSAHWHSIRAAAQMPGLEFYELRHRAIQWMIDPPHDGGLGLDIQSTAHIAGHHAGGYLVCSTYSKLAQHRAIARARRAMDAYQEREQNRQHEQSNLRSRRSRSAKESRRRCNRTAIRSYHPCIPAAPSRAQKSAKCDLF
jgi:hypothetical protein